MKKFKEYIKQMPPKEWIMLAVVIAGICCMFISWSKGEGLLVVLSFLLSVVPATVWFSDYLEYLKLQKEVKELGEWKDNPEWLQVYIDPEEKWLFGIRKNGEVDWQLGVPKPIEEELNKLRKRIEDLEAKK